ncbi:hypothetical protein PIB30_043285 [Stylosanthes scabra]|uniref:Uncharacterized protein n=1 Tax=Stylosanthes scabra TaxID=79078 RepID=A0ABU6XGF9_9FABA|nr:hypothetical protein [Stylosanthes scabra]
MVSVMFPPVSSFDRPPAGNREREINSERERAPGPNPRLPHGAAPTVGRFPPPPTTTLGFAHHPTDPSPDLIQRTGTERERGEREREHHPRSGAVAPSRSRGGRRSLWSFHNRRPLSLLPPSSVSLKIRSPCSALAAVFFLRRAGSVDIDLLISSSSSFGNSGPVPSSSASLPRRRFQKVLVPRSFELLSPSVVATPSPPPSCTI